MTTVLSEKNLITEEQKRNYQEEGYFILENCILGEHLALLRERCDGFIKKQDADFSEKGMERIGLNAKGKRYFASNCYQKEPAIGEFLFSDLMAEICKATVGKEADLFYDQYVVKGPDKDTSFSWHQDSGYVHIDCPMYVTCWITLDDVTLENGTVYLLPYSQVGIRSVVNHIRDPHTNDMVGYFGKDPGLPVIVPAGSIAVFSSYVFHRSGPNLTDKLRRVYVAQYSNCVIHNREGKQTGQAVPFLKNGQIVWTKPS